MEFQTVKNDLPARLKEEVRSRIDLSREVSDEEVKDIICHVILDFAGEEYISLEDRKRLSTSVFNSLRKLDFIQELLEDEDVSDGTRKIEIPLYSVEWLKVGLSTTSIFLRIPGRVANKSQFISF